MTTTEFAPAKINLTLEVLGRRRDGYHEIRSLVVFAADAGDRLTRHPPAKPDAFTVTEVIGPFAASIVGSNLVERAVSALFAQRTEFEAGRLILEKNLPVASGIGGGSADAAAALRLLASAGPAGSEMDLSSIALALGADVPVCLRSRAAMMSGVGERVSPIYLPDGLFAVLVNPLVGVPANKTAQVFARLAAKPLADDAPRQAAPSFESASDVIGYVNERGNDLEKPAREIFPVIDDLLAELRDLAGCRLVRLSGAGPTCFALFETPIEANDGADQLAKRNPRWWVRPTALV